MKGWSPSDWRRMVGILFLGVGGIVSTVLSAYSLKVLADKSNGPWAVAYFAYGTLVLIGIVLTGLSAILGRRTFKFKVGANEIESVGEETPRRIEDSLEEA